MTIEQNHVKILYWNTKCSGPKCSRDNNYSSCIKSDQLWSKCGRVQCFVTCVMYAVV